MEDKEIVKALEIFFNGGGKGFVFANVEIKKDEINEFKHIALSYDVIFDLVNRLQAENERLQDAIDEQDIEIASLWKRIEDTKAEAYKECIEKVEKEIKDWQDDIHINEYDCHKYYFVFERIYEILQELVGEDDGKEKE